MRLVIVRFHGEKKERALEFKGSDEDWEQIVRKSKSVGMLMVRKTVEKPDKPAT